MKLAHLFIVVALVSTMPFAQTLTTSDRRTVNNYDYELWSENNQGTFSLNITASNENGGTFSGSWSNTKNVLLRSGKKFKNNETVSSVGNITIDFAATWSSNDAVKMLGVYGWGYYGQGQRPAGRSTDEIEYYIIQDRGLTYNSATQGTNCTQKGSATIDGIEYNFTTCERNNMPSLSGTSSFMQYFSYPKNTGSHRTSGIISVSKHFEEWAKVGMPMDKLYEVAMKVESYSQSGANGTANVTKNILCIGNSCSIPPPTSSSSGAPTQATTCADFVEYGSTPSNPYTACFQHTNGKCYVCKIENEGDGNTCASDWLWNNTENVDDNLDNGYWYSEVDCPATPQPSSSSSDVVTPVQLPQIAFENIVSQMNSGIYLQTTNDAVVEVFSLSGKKMSRQTFTNGTYSVSLGNLPKGIYIVKVFFGSQIKTLNIPVL